MEVSRRLFLNGLTAASASIPLLMAGCSPVSRNAMAIGMVVFPGYAPWQVAKTKGFFGHTEVTVQQIASIGDIRSAFLAGKLDAYVATFDIFESVEHGAPPGKLVLPLVSSNGGDGVVAAPGITAVADLKGKAIAGEKGLPPVFILEYLLNREGLSLKDVQLSDMPSDQVPAAFLSGRYSAVGTYQPFLDRSIEQRPGSKILATSKETPGLITDFLITSEEVLSNKLDALVDVANGWFRACRFIQSDADDAFKIMARAYSIKESEMRSFASNVKWLMMSDDTSFLDKSKKRNAFRLFDEVGRILASNNPNIAPVAAQDTIDLRLMEKLRSS